MVPEKYFFIKSTNHNPVEEIPEILLKKYFILLKKKKYFLVVDQKYSSKKSKLTLTWF